MDILLYSFYFLNSGTPLSITVWCVVSAFLGSVFAWGQYCGDFILIGIPEKKLNERIAKVNSSSPSDAKISPWKSYLIDSDAPSKSVLRIRRFYLYWYQLGFVSVFALCMIVLTFALLSFSVYDFERVRWLFSFTATSPVFIGIISFLGLYVVCFISCLMGKSRYKENVLDRVTKLQEKERRRSKQRGNSLSDIRDISFVKQQKFDPLKKLHSFSEKNRVFLGLNGGEGFEHKPISVSRRFWNETNIQIMGAPGSGKTKMATNTILQCVRDFGDSCIFIDPKNDEHAPQVLKNNLPPEKFMKLDLRADTPPQINPFGGLSFSDLKNLIISCFGMQESGKESDFYKLMQQDAANAVARSFHGNANIFSLIDAFHALDDKAKDPAKAFISKLESLAELSCIHTESGFSLEDAIEQGVCVYIVGSVSDLNVRFLIQILFARCIQHIMKREAGYMHRQVIMMIDEIRYCLSPYVIDSMGTVRSKKAHLILAHQSEGDYGAVQGKDFQTVKTAIMDNVTLRWLYRATNADTAERAAKETGLILATTSDRAVLAVERNAEVLSSDAHIRETQRYAFDANTMLSLPDGTAVVVGLPGSNDDCEKNARAELIYTWHINYDPTPMKLYTAPTIVRESLEQILQPSCSQEDFH